MGCGKSPLNKFADGGYVSFSNENHIYKHINRVGAKSKQSNNYAKGVKQQKIQ